MTAWNDKLLLSSILIPLIAAVGILMTRRVSERLTQLVTLLGFALPLMVALYLWSQFATHVVGATGYAFMGHWNTGLQGFGISLLLGLNGISLPLYVLAAIVGLAAGLYAMTAQMKNREMFWVLLLIMHGGLMGTFASVDLFFFYFFHEFALIPTFIMIGVWGGRSSWTVAVEATIYLTVGAMLSLIGLIAIYVKSGAQSFNFLELQSHLASGAIGHGSQMTLFGLLLFGFGVLVSLFPFYSWAPKAYAAAPASAAMLHAGVLKKFGLYGLLQIGVQLLPHGAHGWQNLIVWLALANVVLLGIVTMAQWDLKQMLGFSSVMHMGYAFLGIATLSLVGYSGAVLLMFGHGLAVALLFMLATCIQHRTGTYAMTDMGGLAKQAPVLGFFFVAATLANLGLPGFANFWGELVVFVALWQYKPWVLALAALGVIISAVYGLRAVANIFMGNWVEPEETVNRKLMGDLTLGERIPALVLLVALVFVGFWPKSLTQNLSLGVSYLLTNEVEVVKPSVEVAMNDVK
jgi:NADH-quinone oxidoreductase subunit M